MVKPMLDKKRLKAAADKLGMKVTFGSDKPGYYAGSDNKFYSFSELKKLIDETFSKDDLIGKTVINNAEN